MVVSYRIAKTLFFKCVSYHRGISVLDGILQKLQDVIVSYLELSYQVCFSPQ